MGVLNTGSPSTSVGVWVTLKTRIDEDPDLRGRVESVQRGTAQLDRTMRAIGSRVNSSNTFVVKS